MAYDYEVAIVVREEDYEKFHAAKDRYDSLNERNEIVGFDYERITTSNILLSSSRGYTKIYEVKDQNGNAYIVYHGFVEWYAGRPASDGYVAYDFFESHNPIPTDFIRIGQEYDDIVEHLELNSNVIQTYVEKEIIFRDYDRRPISEYWVLDRTGEEKETSCHSEVAIAIPQSYKSDFLKRILEYDQKSRCHDDFSAKDIYELAQTYDNVLSDNGERYFILHWSNITWNSSCDAFRFYESLTLPHDLVRVGEEPKDIKEEYWIDSGIIVPHVEQYIELYSRGKMREW